ncbi:MAG: SCE4755 family polysaccharide monooxygenase-like protein, partial [Polyangiales bacterium]
MSKQSPLCFCTALIASALVPAAVHAHIKLTKPASWIVESSLGDPQKSGPCGPGAGDAMTPTDMVTTFQAGEEIEVEWTETIPHPGHFRIAVAKDRAALADPELSMIGSACDYDESMPPVAAGNVMADNLHPRSRDGFSARSGETFTSKVTLPSEPCEKCTLQLIQWMESHPKPCIYYHCADIKIVAAEGGAAGAANNGGSGGNASPVAGSAGATPVAGTTASVGGSTAVTGGAGAGPAAPSGGTGAGAAASPATPSGGAGAPVVPAAGRSSVAGASAPAAGSAAPAGTAAPVAGSAGATPVAVTPASVGGTTAVTGGAGA